MSAASEGAPEAEPRAILYDGVSARRRAVLVRFEPEGLALVENGEVAAAWPYPTIRRREGEPGLLRLSSTQAPELARLELRDEALAAEVTRRCSGLEALRRSRRAADLRIVGWSLAAAASIVATAVFLVPLAAGRLVPLVPVSLEQRLGEAVDANIRALFGGGICDTREGSAALAALTAKLAAGADLPVPASVAVLSSPVPNALALPGGRIYLFDGLLQKAESADEAAGVLAHELGHVAHRDGLRKLIQAGGSSFLLGLLFGDVTGGGTLVLLGRTLLDSSHSRQAETAADDFAAEVMARRGRSLQPMGNLLTRLGAGDPGRFSFLRSHPVTSERVARLEARSPGREEEPLLTPAEWAALKGICAGLR